MGILRVIPISMSEKYKGALYAVAENDKDRFFNISSRYEKDTIEYAYLRQYFQAIKQENVDKGRAHFLKTQNPNLLPHHPFVRTTQQPDLARLVMPCPNINAPIKEPYAIIDYFSAAKSCMLAVNKIRFNEAYLVFSKEDTGQFRAVMVQFRECFEPKRKPNSFNPLPIRYIRDEDIIEAPNHCLDFLRKKGEQLLHRDGLDDLVAAEDIENLENNEHLILVKFKLTSDEFLKIREARYVPDLRNERIKTKAI